MFQFSCRFAFFINFSSFKPDPENNVNFDAVSNKCANFDEVQFFLNTYLSSQYLAHVICPHWNILHSFQWITANSVLLFLNICHKLHHRTPEVTIITRHTVPNFLNSISSLLMLFFIQPLSGNCYKLLSAETFTFIQTFDQNFIFFTEWRQPRHVDRQCDA